MTAARQTMEKIGLELIEERMQMQLTEKDDEAKDLLSILSQFAVVVRAHFLR